MTLPVTNSIAEIRYFNGMYMANIINLLCIDDELSVLNSYQRVFRDSAQYRITCINDPLLFELNEVLEYDVIICDQRMPGVLGSKLLKKICELGYQGTKIICSAYSDFEDVTSAFNQGHIDYFLSKPWDKNEIRALVNKSSSNGSILNVNSSDKISQVYKLAEKAAKTNVSVYVQGETGTGKELLTHYIHDCSSRSKGPYITVNCATLTTDLFESLMFGHKKGSFTGATEDSVGFYQAAHGGTLFLDEVVDIPMAAQAKILRALQENTITRVGETNNIPVDVRVISASAKSIEEAASEGNFREDLMFRLNVYPIHIPPLRERLHEIDTLFSQFMEKYNYHENWPYISCDSEVKRILMRYSWPGNIRELENLCNYLCAVLDEPRVTMADLPGYVLEDTRFIARKVNERRQENQITVEQALQQCDENKTQAAKLLGISRMTLWRRMKKQGLVE